MGATSVHPSKAAPRFFLASGSPRRRELLARLGVPFEVVVSGIDEQLPGLKPVDLVRRLAVDKVRAVSQNLADGWVLGADTTIDLDGQELAKPRDALHARQMLMRLRGRWHQVLTGVAVLKPKGGKLVAATVSTRVRMRDYSQSEIDAYTESGEPMDKAGAYAIQGAGGDLVDRVQGCYFNVIGLPLCETIGLLIEAGFPADWPPSLCVLASGKTCPRAGSVARRFGLS